MVFIEGRIPSKEGELPRAGAAASDCRLIRCCANSAAWEAAPEEEASPTAIEALRLTLAANLVAPAWNLFTCMDR